MLSKSRSMNLLQLINGEAAARSRTNSGRKPSGATNGGGGSTGPSWSNESGLTTSSDDYEEEEDDDDDDDDHEVEIEIDADVEEERDELGEVEELEEDFSSLESNNNG